MSFDAQLLHTCTIERAGQALDAYQNASRVWSAIAVGVPCRLVEKQERVLQSERVESTVRTAYTLLLPADAQIVERDRISAVTLEDGRVVSSVFTVAALLTRRARVARHVTAQLERVQ